MKFVLNKWTKFSFIFIFFTIFLISTPKTFASTADNVFGYAWSENVGWINFNNCGNPKDATTCASTNFGVNINFDNGKEVSGYAWSENVGWISFNPSEWGDCPPSTTCTGGVSSFVNKWDGSSAGWARAILVPQNTSCLTSLNQPCNSGGWDGWISLNSTTFTSTDISSSIINQSISGFSSFGGLQVFVIDPSKSSGYAWGSEVIGWIDLNHSSYNPTKGGLYLINNGTQPTVTVTASSSSVIAGDTVDITWSVSNFSDASNVSCINSSDPDGNTFADWKTGDTFNTTDGSYSKTVNGVHLKYDPTKMSTDFIVKCTQDSMEYTGTATVTSVPFSVNLNHSYPQCSYPAPSSPSLTWSSNSTKISSCVLTGMPAPSNPVTYYTKSIDITKNTITDNQFKGVSTGYILECTATDGSYQTISKYSNTRVLNVCVPDYDISANSTCLDANNNSVVGAGLTYDGTNYSGSVTLSINPINGFNSNISVNGDGSFLNTFSLTPNVFVNAAGTIIAKLTLDQNQYTSLSTIPIANDPRPAGVLDLITVTASGGGITKTIDLNFCENGGTVIKPKYKPF